MGRQKREHVQIPDTFELLSELGANGFAVVVRFHTCCGFICVPRGATFLNGKAALAVVARLACCVKTVMAGDDVYIWAAWKAAGYPSPLPVRESAVYVVPNQQVMGFPEHQIRLSKGVIA
jgi:hypothetical protein